MQPVLPNALGPKDVLIVEDDPLIALNLEDTLLGYRRGGPPARVATALHMIASRTPDFALLDVGLAKEKSFAVAERLAGLKIPFAFITGNGGDEVPAAFAERPMLAKRCRCCCAASAVEAKRHLHAKLAESRLAPRKKSRPRLGVQRLESSLSRIFLFHNGRCVA